MIIKLGSLEFALTHMYRTCNQERLWGMVHSLTLLVQNQQSGVQYNLTYKALGHDVVNYNLTALLYLLIATDHWHIQISCKIDSPVAILNEKTNLNAKIFYTKCKF